MKLKIKLSIVFFIVLNVFTSQKTFSQCFQIESILVDACGPEEGYNEMVRFKVGTSPLNVNNLSVDWPSPSPVFWQGIAANAKTTAKVATLNAGILAAGGCGKLLQPIGGVLPANAKVVLVTSHLLDITFNFFGAINEDIYIIFQDNDTVDGGHFGNYGTSSLRFLDMTFGSGCSDSIEYNRSLLIDKDGNKKAGDGASVNYTPSGVATYVNIGCNAPVEVFDVNAGTSPITACQDATVSLSGTAQGQQSVTWSDGGKGGVFSAENNLNTSYTLSSTATGTITLTLTATNSCGTSKSSTVTLNVTTKVVPNFATTLTICSGDVAQGLSLNSPNGIAGTWFPTSINNTVGGEYTFTPNAGQCATTTKLTVTLESCGYGIFASAAWLKNCNAAGEFYNITGSGADLINPGSPEGSFITNLGAYVQNSGLLTFGGGEIKTFKSTTGNVCGATMFYNVHLQSDPAGTFTPLTLQFFSNCNSGSFNIGGGPCKDRDQKWQTVNSNLLDLTALSSGNYVLEVYYSLKGDSNSNTDCDDNTVINNSGLNYRSTFSIQGAPQYASTNPTTCAGNEGTITISGLGTNTSYEISYKDDAVSVGPTTTSSNASGAILISGLNAGSYSDFLVKASCGSYTNATPIVLVNPALIATTSKTDNSVCQSATVPCNGSATVNPTGSGSYSYLWDDTLAQTTATATALCQGTYNVLVTDLVSLCNVTKTIIVGNTAILPSVTSLTRVTTPICSGGNAAFTVKGSPNATVTYTINAGTSQTIVLDATGNAPVQVNTATSDVTIVLSLVTLGSCSAIVTNTETVIVSTPPNAGDLGGNQVICSNGTTTFSSTVAGGVWSSSNNSIATIDASSGVISAVSSGTATMTYTVTGTGGCTNVAKDLSVTISSTPTVDITGRCIGKDYTLEVSPSSGVTYKWFRDGTELTGETVDKLVVKTQGTYKVEINNLGCTAEAIENVTAFYCDIPKGISPNGDTKNDIFDLSNLNVKKLEIFNRYGVKVYSKTNYKKEWDGKSDGGQELPDATYYYVIEEEGNSPVTGWVYINR